MSNQLPAFKNPPLVETALSVQFHPIPGFTNGHLGLFWNKIRDQFPTSSDGVPVEPQIERFENSGPSFRAPQFRIAEAKPYARILMQSADKRSMVQLQNGRLIYNWLRPDEAEYPRWPAVFAHFKKAWEAFEEFATQEKFSKISAIQWEVVYVNHLQKGKEWNTPADWAAVVPGLIGRSIDPDCVELETAASNCHYCLKDNRGRLHVDFTHRCQDIDGENKEILALQLTARGGFDAENGILLEEGMTYGREAIVRSFNSLTGESAQNIWGLIQ